MVTQRADAPHIPPEPDPVRERPHEPTRERHTEPSAATRTAVNLLIDWLLEQHAATKDYPDALPPAAEGTPDVN